MDDDINKTAVNLYNIYCGSVDNISINGDKLQSAYEFFNDSKFEKQANAWRNVARYVVQK